MATIAAAPNRAFDVKRIDIKSPFEAVLVLPPRTTTGRRTRRIADPSNDVLRRGTADVLRQKVCRDRVHPIDCSREIFYGFLLLSLCVTRASRLLRADLAGYSAESRNVATQP